MFERYCGRLAEADSCTGPIELLTICWSNIHFEKGRCIVHVDPGVIPENSRNLVEDQYILVALDL